ncbi:carboxymuconolactone decarboxylase family protein [Janibacter sp. G368]
MGRSGERLSAGSGLADGAIPHKQRELVAVACAHVTKSVYRREVHVKAA